ncbi:hypothetical protein COCNU_09G005310 [Cocos nucifera]|uniref:C2H2-type domain-containing protein n=1 Tax=Cocos nucifera TaxID=13894 RepID=A0A8K0N7F6_COCNU|nr:hypothetical protein COCNU_09G005300 [Cocos nucifera]KAG1361068.1 hypothetical protein COCNU_09G005310 [Cocos nucifera]
MSDSHSSLPPSGLLAAASGLGGDGGDDNPRRRHLPSTHAVDANPAFPDEEEKPDPDPNDGNDPTSAAFGGGGRCRKKKCAGISPPLRCPVCRKEFANPKALHGHMRCHPDRSWRGITPPALRPESEKEVAASLVRLSGSEDAWVKRYRCSRCGRDFDTRQALGGHRASHRSVKGCHAKSTYEGRNGNGDHGAMRNDGRPGGHVGKGGIRAKIGDRRRRRWKTSTEAAAAAESSTAKEMATDTVVHATAAAEVVAETAEVAAAVERRGLLLDLNLPVPPEDKKDDSSSGIIDLNKKLPGHDDE